MAIGSQVDTAVRAAGKAGAAVPASKLQAYVAEIAKRLGPMSNDEVAVLWRSIIDSTLREVARLRDA